MAADGKFGPSVGEVLRSGLADLQNTVIVAFPTTVPTGPDFDR